MEKYSTGVKLVIHSLFRQKKDVIYYLILTLVVAVLGMVVPTSIGIITDRILVSEIRQSILAMGIAIILTVMACLFINILVNRINVRVQSRSEYYVFSHVLVHIMQMNSNDEKNLSRQLVGTFQSFLVGIEVFVSNLFFVLIYGIQAVFLIIIIAMRGYGTIDTPCVFMIIFASFILFAFLLRKTNTEKTAERELRSNYNNFSKEMIDNIEAIKNSGSEREMQKRLEGLYRNYMPHKLKAENNIQWVSIILTLIYGIGIWFVFFVTSYEVEGSIGEVAVLISMFGLLNGYLSMLITSVFGIASSRNQLRFADEVLERPIELYDEEGTDNELSGSICFENVNFSYRNSGIHAIKDISLEIKKGEYVGIVGPSGCGKSTLIRLLLGFERPDSGRISFDNNDILQCNVQSLRRQFGVVLQDAALFNGTIANNIGLCEHPDMKRVEEAAKAADIYDEVMEMPMKFNTLISGESELVSGGQRQRIVLARALMNNPKILLLDEATSAMDNMTQRIVKENLDRLGTTRIVLAHRLSTIRDCDRIIVMDKGRIVSVGTYDELMEEEGLFARMARRGLK